MKQDENLRNLRQFDSDKYHALLFAPKDKTGQLAALFNFHYEVSQIPLEVSEPMVGMIKFQWWRDCFDEMRDGKPPRPHPVLLGLKNSNVNLNQLEIVLNYYEKLLDNWQPHSFGELEEFILNTQVIIFEQMANILETVAHENSARAYGLTFLARKIHKNSGFYKFATEPTGMAKKLIDKSKDLLSYITHPNVFDLITAYYNNNLDAPRWKLLLKLAFSKASLT